MPATDHQHHAAPPRMRRAIAEIGVADFLRRVLGPRVVWMLLSCLLSTASAQESSPAKDLSEGAGASASHSGVEQIRNPKLRAVLQSNGALKRTASNKSDRSISSRPSAPVPTPAVQHPVHRHEADELTETPSVRRASYEEQILAIRGENHADVPSESTAKPATDSTSTQIDDAAPVTTTQSPSTGDIPEALQKTPESKTREIFLDLTGQTTSASAESGKPVGEHGAALSIEPSPQQVLYRAVAWLVIALCLFSLAALGVRKWQRQRGLLPTNNSSSRVLETLSLGPGRAVSLIEMAGHRALVAFDAGGIRHMVLAPRSFDEDLVSEEQDDNTASLSVSSESDIQRRTAM
ncbi:MAG: hypothetical protein ACK58L_03895 [Planctomycetota bacterium]